MDEVATKELENLEALWINVDFVRLNAYNLYYLATISHTFEIII